ncbi:hypothetical protein ACJX0J_035390, partial [Zea mays]
TRMDLDSCHVLDQIKTSNCFKTTNYLVLSLHAFVVLFRALIAFSQSLGMFLDGNKEFLELDCYMLNL